MTNPYQPPSPAGDPYLLESGPFEAVLRVATLQRQLNLAVLANLGVKTVQLT